MLAQVNPAGLPAKVDCTTFPTDSQATCANVVAATPAGAVPKCAALRDQLRCIELARLGRVLGMGRRDVWRAYEKTLLVNADGSGGCVASKGTCYVVNAGAPLPISTASEPQVAYVLERRDRFPGVQFIETTQRQYPFGKLVAPNVLGYDGQISGRGAEGSQLPWARPRAVVGTGRCRVLLRLIAPGSERGASAELRRRRTRGRPGATWRRRPLQDRRSGCAIDYRLQQVAQKAIFYGIQVAQNDGEVGRGRWWPWIPTPVRSTPWPRTPATSPSAFLPPAKRADGALQRQVRPAAGRQDAAAGGTRLDVQADHGGGGAGKGLIGPGSQLDCPASSIAKATSRTRLSATRNPFDSGIINLPTALEISCDTFFYQLGNKFYDHANQGIDFQRQIRRFGFGATPAIDTAGALVVGRPVPDPAWRLQHYPNPIDQVWQPGYDIQMAIGQGDLTISPMQLAIAYSALANGGKLRHTSRVGRALLGSDGQVTEQLAARHQRASAYSRSCWLRSRTA